MTTRRTIRKWMASALYSELDAAQRAELERCLAESPALRREFDALRRTVESIPKDPIELPIDLLPAIRRRIESSPAPAFPRRRWGVPAMAGLAAGLLIWFALGLPGTLQSRTNRGREASGQTWESTMVAQLIRETSALMAQGDNGNAMVVLQTVVEAHGDDPLAGEAQMQLAELFFGRLRRYREAFEAYRTLKMKYPAVFAGRPQNADRLDLLDECRKDDFAALHLLDAARNRRGMDLGLFEEVVARYPAHQVASIALKEMVDRVLMSGADLGDGPPHLRALDHARRLCSNPVAVARLDLELGRGYWKHLQDMSSAQRLGRQAMESGNPQVAAMARAFLDELNTNSPP